MPIYAFNRLIEVFGEIKKKKVTFLGVSYRGDVGDTRFSPVEPLVNIIRAEGSEIKLHDPFVSFWEEQNCSVESDLDTVLEFMPDLVIISTGHSYYKKESTIQQLMEIAPTQIYDTIGLFDKDQLLKLQSRHKVSVLGRGDI